MIAEVKRAAQHYYILFHLPNDHRCAWLTRRTNCKEKWTAKSGSPFFLYYEMFFSNIP